MHEEEDGSPFHYEVEEVCNAPECNRIVYMERIADRIIAALQEAKG